MKVAQGLPTEKPGNVGVFGVASGLVAELVLGGVRPVHGAAITEVLGNHPVDCRIVRCEATVSAAT